MGGGGGGPCRRREAVAPNIVLATLMLTPGPCPGLPWLTGCRTHGGGGAAGLKLASGIPSGPLRGGGPSNGEGFCIDRCEAPEIFWAQDLPKTLYFCIFGIFSHGPPGVGRPVGLPRRGGLASGSPQLVDIPSRLNPLHSFI